jgi:hypothetical protein
MADNSIRADVAWEEAVEVLADLAEQTGHFLEKEILLGFIGKSRTKLERSPHYYNHIVLSPNHLVNSFYLLPDPSDEVLRLLLVENRKIPAIKRYRRDTNIDLRGAKAALEWYEVDYKLWPGRYTHLFVNRVLE